MRDLSETARHLASPWPPSLPRCSPAPQDSMFLLDSKLPGFALQGNTCGLQWMISFKKRSVLNPISRYQVRPKVCLIRLDGVDFHVEP